MKKTRLLGLANTILTGSLTFFSWFIFSSAFKETSPCEFCSIMWIPATVFSVLFLPGVYTLFVGGQKLTSQINLLNTINIIAITISGIAVIFNFLA